MTLTEHQRYHINAAVRDADGERGARMALGQRIATRARALSDWPPELKRAADIHDWLEEQESDG